MRLRLLIRFRDVNSLIKYLREELDKLSVTKRRLEEVLGMDAVVDIVELKDDNIDITRVRTTELKWLLNEIDTRIEAISVILEELRDRLGGINYTGLVLLELEDGIPRRVLLSQPLSLG